MKIVHQIIKVSTSSQFDFVPLTNQVQKVVEESKIREGFVLLRCPHTTAAITCTERDPAVHHDAQRVLEMLIPHKQDWEHNSEGSINARAHQAVMLLFGSCHWIPVTQGEISLGTWQGVFLVELFEARARNIQVTVVGEE